MKFSVHEKNQSLHDAFASDVKQESIVGTKSTYRQYGPNGCSLEGAVCHTDKNGAAYDIRVRGKVVELLENTYNSLVVWSKNKYAW